MAMRRDPGEGQEASTHREEEKVVEFPKELPPSGTRQELIEAGRQIVAERRRLLERLAAYDRGDDAGHRGSLSNP